VRIDASELHYSELNRQIRAAVAAGELSFDLVNVNGQRYIADGISAKAEFDIHGVPGNDLGAFMDGPTLRVHANAQDGVSNTMNAGRVIIHGHAGDVLGYGMRGGDLFVRGRVGYRVGIHMKAYRENFPVLIAGGTAGDFLGEYMAGGLLVVLGLDRRPNEPIVGHWCATGMHGGSMYLRGDVAPERVASQFVSVHPAGDEDLKLLRPHLTRYAEAFELNTEELLGEPFFRVAPLSHRPFGAKYAAA
jgi:glutamate synthase domain-containing protein 3